MPLGSDFAGGLDDWWQAIAGIGQQPTYDTQLSPEQEQAYQAWKLQNAPRDSGADYDLRGAFQAGLSPDPQSGHWPDTFKKPGHPTFSNQSQYAAARPDLAGSWQGDNYIPPARPSGAEMFRGAVIPASKGFQEPEQPPAVNEMGMPIVQPPGANIGLGGLARQTWRAIQADPTGGVFERGAPPIEAIPNRPKTAQELAAQLSAGRNQLNPLEAMLGVAGGPGGGVLAAAPIAAAARNVLRSGTARVAGEMAAPNVISSKRELITPVPWAAEQYPMAGASGVKVDRKSGKEFTSKLWTPEEQMIAERRDVANRNIKSGNWEPYYNIEQRKMVSPEGYPGYRPTLEQRGADTKSGREALRLRLEDIQGAEGNILKAYQRGEREPGAYGFYQMKQWEDEYIKEFGLEEGRRRFQRAFAESMAGTTSGNTPEMNFIVGERAKWMAEHGIPFPPRGEGANPTIPYPASGASKGVNNYLEWLKQVHQGGGVEGGGIDWMTNPKKYNFAYNFMGSGGPTIDKQMMELISQSKKEMPPTGGYGVYEQPVHNVAQQVGRIRLRCRRWPGPATS